MSADKKTEAEGLADAHMGEVAASTTRRETILEACLVNSREIASKSYDFPERMPRADWLLLIAITVICLVLMYVGGLL